MDTIQMIQKARENVGMKFKNNVNSGIFESDKNGCMIGQNRGDMSLNYFLSKNAEWEEYKLELTLEERKAKIQEIKDRHDKISPLDILFIPDEIKFLLEEIDRLKYDKTS